MHKPIKYAEKAVTVAAGAAWIVFDQVQPNQPEPVLHAEVVRQAAAEELPEAEAATGLAARDRFALPALHSRNPAADRGRRS